MRRLAACCGIALVATACKGGAPAPAASTAEILAAQGAGQAMLQQDRLAEAQVEYERLVSLAPEDPTGYAGLGLVALRAGDLEEAERQLLAARGRSPDDVELILALGRLRQEAGELDAARALYSEVVTLDASDARAYWALAELERELAGPGAEARVAWLERAVGADPGNLAARVELADAHFATGAADPGLAELEALRQLAPDFAPRSRAAFEAAEDAAGAGDAATALARLTEFRADFELTGGYQEGLGSLRPPQGELVGIPTFSFSFLTGSFRVLEEADVLAGLRYAEASELSGLEALGGAGVSPDPDEGSAATLALGDFDDDGDEDLLWVTGGEARLLRVDLGRFVDASDELGTLEADGAAVAVWGDFDDDRRLDIWLAGSPSRLYRNEPGGGFAEVELPSVPDAGPARAAFFADLDQDGDLDVFEARRGPNRLYRNNGDGTFAEMAESFGLTGGAADDTRDAAFADLDDDRDLDVALAQGAGGLRVYANQRGGRFEDATEVLGLADTGSAAALALGDVNADGDIDIASGSDDRVALFLGSPEGTFTGAAAFDAVIDRFETRDLELVDFDNDGRTDLAAAGLGPEGDGLHLFRNEGGGAFAATRGHLPPTAGNAWELASLDYNEDGDADLVYLEFNGRPRLYRNDGGSANHYVRIELVGLGDGSRKNNRFGIGARLEVRAGDLYQVHTVTDPTVLVGLNGRLKADVIRVHWPNGVIQDLYFPGTDQDLIEQQTLKGSCPLLYVWNGEGFEFVGDIMWKSALGMPLGILGSGERAYAPAFPSQEYRRLPDGVLEPRDGEYVMQVTEELWETIYVDGLELVAVDHPDGIDVYVDERFVPPAPTELELWRVGERHRPIAATDGRGRDHREALGARDFYYVSDFRPGRFQGIAEPHELILDLGDQARAGDVTLYLTGWIFPTDASINVAMGQSDALGSRFPALDVIGPDGTWQPAVPDLGFPSGKDKTVVVDLAGRFPTDDRRVRIRTNLMIYWDEAFFTVGSRHPAEDEVRVTRQSPDATDFHYRGFSREFRRGGRYGPHWFDYDSVTTDPKWHDLEGLYTRYGDVTELVEEGDDAYVIANAGDELTVRFDASAYPDLPEGWRRTWLIYSDGWVKDGDLNTATGDRVEPLPSRRSPAYPDGVVDPRAGAGARWLDHNPTRRISRQSNAPPTG